MVEVGSGAGGGGPADDGERRLCLGCPHLPLNKVSTRIWKTGLGVSICYRASWKRDFEADTSFQGFHCEEGSDH